MSSTSLCTLLLRKRISGVPTPTVVFTANNNFAAAMLCKEAPLNAWLSGTTFRCSGPLKQRYSAGAGRELFKKTLSERQKPETGEPKQNNQHQNRKLGRLRHTISFIKDPCARTHTHGSVWSNAGGKTTAYKPGDWQRGDLGRENTAAPYRPEDVLTRC